MAFFETVVSALLNLNVAGVSVDELAVVALTIGAAVWGYGKVSEHFKAGDSKK